MFHLRSGQRSQEHSWKHKGHSSERTHGHRGDTGLCGCTASTPEGRLCICDLRDLQSTPSHIPGHSGLPRGETALHSGCTRGDLGTGDSGCRSSCRGPSRGKMMVSTAPRRCRPGERSHPCTAGSLSSEARCMHCNSNHTLCMSCWRGQGSTVEHSSHADSPQRAGPCLDLGRRYSWPENHSFYNACRMADKHGCHQDSALGSRYCCRCQGGTERGWSHTRSKRRVLCHGRFCRRSDIFYKLLSPQNIRKGNREHSGPLAAGAGHSGTSGRHCRCGGGPLHSAGTEDGSQHSSPRG